MSAVRQLVVGVAGGALLTILGLLCIASGGGHGSLRPLVFFGAPISLVRPMWLFGPLALWSAIGSVMAFATGYTRRVALLALLTVHYVAAAALLLGLVRFRWNRTDVLADSVPHILLPLAAAAVTWIALQVWAWFGCLQSMKRGATLQLKSTGLAIAGVFAGVFGAHALLHFVAWSFAARDITMRIVWIVLASPLVHLAGSLTNAHFWPVALLNSVLWSLVVTYGLKRLLAR